MIVAVAPGSPAARAGVRTGDVLESIEGIGTAIMSVWEAEARLRGPQGSSVDLRLIRARRAEPAQLTLARETTPRPRVQGEVVESGVGVLEIPSFEAGTAEAIAAQLKMLEKGAAKGLVLDLRDNAEGVVEEAVRAADLFLPAGKTIVSRRDRDGKAADLTAQREPLTSVPAIMILVDAGTSGPAEIFAAALKDNGLAQILGEKTNGWGAEHKEFQLADGSLLVLATELYYRSSGEPIQGESARNSGISPDHRSPSNTFVSNFYFDNVTDNLDDGPGDDFYIRLESAIERQQMQDAIAAIRESLEKAA
jgi:carboxyl-terminal processing protease